jgi:pimeloyl-ACP methyl ester carboxylesterase
MLPVLFGPRDGRLFGVFHGASAAPRAEGIVLCQPMGHEYIRAHRTFRQIAVQLAEAGFPVMRFDYFGCGDSTGDGAEGTLPRWIADVHAAIDELRETAGVPAVSLVGLRLGASIALLAAASRADVRRIMLCDPVLDGRAYLAELRTLQRRWLKGRPDSRLFAFNPRGTELIGFPLPAAVQQDIEHIDLRGAVAQDASRVRVLAAGGDWDVPAQVHNGLNVPGMGGRLTGMLTEAWA